MIDARGIPSSGPHISRLGIVSTLASLLSGRHEFEQDRPRLCYVLVTVKCPRKEGHINSRRGGGMRSRVVLASVLEKWLPITLDVVEHFRLLLCFPQGVLLKFSLCLCAAGYFVGQCADAVSQSV